MMSRHRLCMYPEPWALVKLGSIAESEKGKKPKSQTDQQSPSHSVPYIDIQAFEKRNHQFLDGWRQLSRMP